MQVLVPPRWAVDQRLSTGGGKLKTLSVKPKMEREEKWHQAPGKWKEACSHESNS